MEYCKNTTTVTPSNETGFHKYKNGQKIWFSQNDSKYAGVIEDSYYNVDCKILDKRVKI